MSEYIDRMLIINYLKSRRGNFIDDVGKGYDAGIASALRAVEKMPSSDVVPRDHNAGWISVKDRLPEDELPEDSKRLQIKCLVAIKGKNGYTVRTQNRIRQEQSWSSKEPFTDWYWRFAHGEVTHWMPLPEAPKEDEK